MTNAPLILVVEDDVQISRVLQTSLEGAGYRVAWAATLGAAIGEARSRQPDLVLLDLGLPDGDGLSLIPQLREFSVAPIVVLSARGREEDKIRALDLGADDFVAKPFSIGEVQARIRAGLRRQRQATYAEPIFRFGNLRVDLEGRSLRRNDEEIHLTPTEFKLLLTLIEHRGKAMTQRFLLNAVWGPQSLDQAQYLRVYMAQLRRKIEADPARPRYLKTETGVGYRFVPED
ncbi:response regulator [Bryobacter aggregatus]|uniref:response regulator n=1 Tax=Bryobacter aggregatus TaxID=360054 RepID=UPI0004E27CEF|nr:response regulator [Bryobacter aggregatus]